MCNHLNNEVAKASWNSDVGRDRHRWLTSTVAFINKFKVDVIFGDYNMFLFHFVKHLRSCGIIVDVVAWFPWKLHDGTPCVDSCCILIVNQRGYMKLCKGLECIHARDPSGFLYRGKPTLDTVATDKAAVAARRKGMPADDKGVQQWVGGFEVMATTDRGCGKTLDEYASVRRSSETAESLLKEFLTPSSTQAEIEAAAKERGTDADSRRSCGDFWVTTGAKFKRSCLYTLEKRSDKNFILWQNSRAKPDPETERLYPTGGHYPLVFFTANNSNRSPHAKERRDRRTREIFGPFKGKGQGKRKRGKTDAAVAAEKGDKGKKGAGGEEVLQNPYFGSDSEDTADNPGRYAAEELKEVQRLFDKGKGKGGKGKGKGGEGERDARFGTSAARWGDSDPWWASSDSGWGCHWGWKGGWGGNVVV